MGTGLKKVERRIRPKWGLSGTVRRYDHVRIGNLDFCRSEAFDKYQASRSTVTAARRWRAWPATKAEVRLTEDINKLFAAKPQPMISNDSLVSAFAPGQSSEVQDYAPASRRTEDAIEPKTSFFRGAAVGLAVAIPVWTAIILWLLR